MKKLIRVLALLLAMMVALSACAGTGDDPEDEKKPGNSQQQTDPEPSETDGGETAPTETTAPEIPVDPVSVEEPDLSGIQVTVTEVGTIAYNDQIRFASELPVFRTTVDEMSQYTFLSYLGEDLMGRTWNAYDSFGEGILAAYTYSENVPQCSLINVNTGEVYLDDNACQIQQMSRRFYYVIYATEKTDNQDEAFIYFTDRMFSMAPEEGDLLYKGYAKIFDLEKGKFVPNLTLEEPYDVAICDDKTICVEIDWYTSDVYTVDGECVGQGVDAVTVCQNMIVQETSDGLVIYDSEFNRLRTVAEGEILSEDAPVYPTYSGKYLKYYDDNTGLRGVMDMGGNELLPAQFVSINNAYFDYIFAAQKVDGEYRYGIYLADGTEILPCAYDLVYADDDVPVVHFSDTADNDYLYIPRVGAVNVNGYSRSGWIYYSGEEYLVFATGKTMTLPDGEELANILVYSPGVGLVELINGQVLIPAEAFAYDRVIATEEYLYGINWETKEITVYEVEIG